MLAKEDIEKNRMTMTINQILSDAKEGKHAACNPCPWNPRRLRDVAFGKSGGAGCNHAVNWRSTGKAISVTIVRDPGGTTPQKTELLCFACNSKNPSDQTANHAFDLWKAAVSLSLSTRDSDIPYLSDHYWTNAIMHSAVDKKTRDKELSTARRSCKDVLQYQIEALSPRVIIACGEHAVNSLNDNGLLTKKWSKIVPEFRHGAYTETTNLVSDYKVRIYCTYHTGITAVNCIVAKLYDDTTKSELLQRAKLLPNPIAFNAFLNQWYPPTMNAERTDMNAESKGMRVLLLHWLDIGEAIRQAHREALGANRSLIQETR